jgi:hypothetical protein
LVAVTVAVSVWDISTSTFVDSSWAVANAAVVISTHAVVYVVADAVAVRVSCASAVTHAKGVKLVTIAIAIPFWDVCATALVNRAWTVANAAGVISSNAVVHVVTDAIDIGIRRAVTATYANGVKLVSVTVAVSFGDVCASALVDRSGAVADAALVVGTHAVVHVVTDAV